MENHDHLLAILFQLAQLLLVVLAAPLLTGWVNQCQASLQNRSGAGVLQPYRVLRKLFHKDAVIAHDASPLFRVTPYIVFGCMWLAAAIIPIIAVDLAFSQAADVIALVGVFALLLPKGLDHILFVLGLFLLSTRKGPLLIQVTAFTVAHTLTLALAVYGVVSLPRSIVEPLIAASIAYVALENILTPKLKPWRAWVVFGFGLLHGLGFAGVLQELGLPRAHLLPALASFNVGVELGQLAVNALAFLAAGIAGRNHSWYRPRVVIPASATIAAVAVFWTVQRLIEG